MGVRDVGAVPFFAGVGVVAMMMGTMFGQAGHDTFDTADNVMSEMGDSKLGPGSPMAGMKMGSGSSGSMAGMKMGSGSASSSSMPGMKMGSDSGHGPTSSGATMTMPDGSTMPSATMPSATMPMNMSDPKMAASMPGGLHSDCKSDTCTVIFAPDATGVAKVLGTTAKLESAQAKQIVLLVGKKKLTLRQGKPATDGNLRIELTDASPHGYTVKFTRTH